MVLCQCCIFPLECMSTLGTGPSSKCFVAADDEDGLAGFGGLALHGEDRPCSHPGGSSGGFRLARSAAPPALRALPSRLSRRARSLFLSLQGARARHREAGSPGTRGTWLFAWLHRPSPLASHGYKDFTWVSLPKLGSLIVYWRGLLRLVVIACCVSIALWLCLLL